MTVSMKKGTDTKKRQYLREKEVFAMLNTETGGRDLKRLFQMINKEWICYALYRNHMETAL